MASGAWDSSSNGGGGAAAAGGGSRLTVLTLNTWGLWLIAKKRAERMKHLAAYLSSTREDVVLLQEVWVDADALMLIRAARRAGLVHATHFRSGVFGAGLVTLSRWPIVRHAFWKYAASGFASALACGDFYAGKGVGWVRLNTPLGLVDVFNTHLHANYCHEYRHPPAQLRRAASAAADALEMGYGGKDASDAAALTLMERGRAPDWVGSRVPDDDDAGTRIAQLLELSEVVDLVSGSSSSGSSSGGSWVVVAGDLNCKPDTIEVDLLRLRLPHLRDAWATAAERSSSDEHAASAAAAVGGDCVSLLPGGAAALNPEGFTCHAPGSAFKSYRQVPERIDYVWSNMACLRAEVTLQSCPPPQGAGGGAAGAAGSGGAGAPGGSSGSNSKARRNSNGTSVVSSSNRRGRVPHLSYSDHFAVRAVLTPPPPAAAGAGGVRAAGGAVLEVSPAKLAPGVKQGSGGLAKLSPVKLSSTSNNSSSYAFAAPAAGANAAADANAAPGPLGGGFMPQQQQHAPYQQQQQQHQQQQQQQHRLGAPAAVSTARHKVSTAYAAMMLLEEGSTAFTSSSRLLMAVGGFVVASVMYFCIGAPLFWPDWAFSGAGLTGASLAAVGGTILGLLLVVMGGVGDVSQQRALVNATRLMRTWMAAQGLAAAPSCLDLLQPASQP